MSLETLYTVAEAAEHLKVHESYIWRRIRRGLITVTRLGNNRLVRVGEAELQRFINSRIGAPDTRRRKPRS